MSVLFEMKTAKKTAFPSTPGKMVQFNCSIHHLIAIIRLLLFHHLRNSPCTWCFPSYALPVCMVRCIVVYWELLKPQFLYSVRNVGSRVVSVMNGALSRDLWRFTDYCELLLHRKSLQRKTVG